jgi:MoxR-like ATPase
VLELQDAVERIRVDESILDYLMAIVAATRASPLLALGVSPRGSLALLRAGQAHALADGREYLVPDDIKALAVPALAHRVIVKARAEASGDGGTDAAIIRGIVQEIPVPR